MIDLSRFCADKNDPREYLRREFSFRTHSAASDGNLAIVIPRRVDIPPLNNILTDRINAILTRAIKRRGTESGTLRLAGLSPEQAIPDGIDAYPVWETQRIGAAFFARRYLLMIKHMPNATLYAYARREASLIVFTGGLGLLMPVDISRV